MIDKDTVVLDLDDYNELRDFKNDIEAGMILVKGRGLYNQLEYNSVLVDHSEFVEIFEKTNASLSERISELEDMELKYVKLKRRNEDLEKALKETHLALAEIVKPKISFFQRWMKKF